MTNENKHIHMIKIAVLGETCVGKTCLVRTYDTGVFKENTDRIIGGDYFNKRLKVQNLTTELFIGVVAGQQSYPSLMPIFAKISDGILLLYDVANINTFKTLRKWCKTVRAITPGAIIFIIGARSDLLDEKQVSREAGQIFATSENLEFFECSAKTGENVSRVFEQMTLRILQKKGLMPTDKIEVEGSSLEWKEIKELPATPVTATPVIRRKDIILNYIYHIAVFEQMTLRVLQKKGLMPTDKIEIEGSSLEWKETKELPVTPVTETEHQDTSSPQDKNSQTGNVGESMLIKKDDITSSQSNIKIKTSELNENGNPPDDKKDVLPKSALSEEEMLYQGKCPT